MRRIAVAVLPKSIDGLIEYCLRQSEEWAVDPAGIGLTADMVSKLAELAEIARSAEMAATAAREASKAATTVLSSAVTDLRDRAAVLIRQVKAFAELQDMPGLVYARAHVPVPQSPSPLPAPGGAEDVRVDLLPGGAVALSWTARDAAASTGAMFVIKRRLPGQKNFTTIGAAPGPTRSERRATFVDESLPSSAGGCLFTSV